MTTNTGLHREYKTDAKSILKTVGGAGLVAGTLTVATGLLVGAPPALMFGAIVGAYSVSLGALLAGLVLIIRPDLNQPTEDGDERW